MSLADFIFSVRKRDRIKQHLLFWGIWYLYITFTHAANPLGSTEISYFRNPVFTLTESFFTVFAQVPTVYTMLYFVFPNFILKRKYLLTLVWIFVLWFLCGAITLILLGKVMQPFLTLVLPPEKIFTPPKIKGTSFFMAVMATNRGAYTIIASALMLKFGKHWYHKRYRNLQLQKENTEAQLQLLTAQVHPHFLFNTLNNIFSKTQTESPGGSRMIISLSDMLRYILYEGQKPLVPLKQEFTMVAEYIELERMRYGDKLEVHMLTPDVSDDIYIAPLLLLPFVENCFKHGADNLLQNPWMNLTIELKDTTLIMKLMNGKTPTRDSSQDKPGMGISNVRKRLELLYNGKYEIQITEDEEVFVVDLQVQLVRISGTAQSDAFSKPESNIAYA
jgi:sensor histidine kinase YesM